MTKNFTQQLKVSSASAEKATEKRFETAQQTLLQKKPKKSTTKLVVRDTFSMPEMDLAKIEELRNKALKLGHVFNKSEVIRGGLLTLCTLSPEQLVQSLQKVERVATGRRRP